MSFEKEKHKNLNSERNSHILILKTSRLFKYFSKLMTKAWTFLRSCELFYSLLFLIKYLIVFNKYCENHDKIINHFFIKQQTSLFRKKIVRKFFLNTQFHIWRDIKIIILFKKKFKKKTKKDGQIWSDVTRCGQMWWYVVICGERFNLR